MTARCTPRHMVSYHGEFYAAGEEIEIDPADAEVMSAYGPVEFDEDEPDDPPGPQDGEPEEPPGPQEGEPAPPPRRRRRA